VGDLLDADEAVDLLDVALAGAFVAHGRVAGAQDGALWRQRNNGCGRRTSGTAMDSGGLGPVRHSHRTETAAGHSGCATIHRPESRQIRTPILYG